MRPLGSERESGSSGTTGWVAPRLWGSATANSAAWPDLVTQRVRRAEQQLQRRRYQVALPLAERFEEASSAAITALRDCSASVSPRSVRRTSTPRRSVGSSARVTKPVGSGRSSRDVIGPEVINDDRASSFGFLPW